MTSSRPYLLRAMYEWIVDNGMTPHILVSATNDVVKIPRQYEQDGKIVLNISPTAVHSLDLGLESVSFDARFDGQAMNVDVPIEYVLAIYTRENGQGMMFTDDDKTPPSPTDDSEKSKHPHLRVVK